MPNERNVRPALRGDKAARRAPAPEIRELLFDAGVGWTMGVERFLDLLEGSREGPR